MLKNKIFFFGLIYAIIFILSGPVRADNPFNYDPKGRRDPFTPLVNREGLLFEPAVRKENIVSDIAADNALSLEGIVYEEGGSSCAIINSEIVQSGDKIGDYQVLEVQKQKVILGKAEEILELELKKEDE